MKAEDFIAFLAMMKWSDAEAMRQLGIGSHHTLQGYKEKGGPLWLGLACAAAARELPPWKKETVTVFSFRVWDAKIGDFVVAQSKRRREDIATIPGAEIIPGTDEDVPLHSIDEWGRYARS